MSDIHGCFTAFQKMLEKIGFCDEDRLIIAGDIIDRGPENYEMLKWFENRPDNVEMIMGNHEYDFAYEDVPHMLASIGDYRGEDWADRYLPDEDHDLYETINGMICKNNVTPDMLAGWAEMIRELPYYKILEINGRKYIIVHAAYVSDERYKMIYGSLNGIEEFYIWNRDAFLYDDGPGDTIIFGHTPTISDAGYGTDGKVFVEEYRGNTFIDIDCGYVYKERHPQANMAAIRLEDEKIFYLES